MGGDHETVVDYFSLVVDDGSELDILQSIAWDKVHIKMLTVAWNTTKNAALPQYMESVGYKTAQQMRFYFIDYLIFFKWFAHPTAL